MRCYFPNFFNNSDKLSVFNAESFTLNPSNSTWSSKNRVDEQENDDIDTDEVMMDKLQANQTERTGYVSQTAVALRCRAMPPPCLKNPYVMNQSETATDPFGYQRSKCASKCVVPQILTQEFPERLKILTRRLQ